MTLNGLKSPLLSNFRPKTGQPRKGEEQWHRQRKSSKHSLRKPGISSWNLRLSSLTSLMFSTYLRHPETTVIGNENHCRKAWVERMLQVDAKDRGMSLTVISSTITAANCLASTSLALSSLVGAWIGSTSHNTFTISITYGDTSPALVSVKYISILTCFLLALASFLHCIRDYVHANFLISMPDSDIPQEHVEKVVISGGLF